MERQGAMGHSHLYACIPLPSAPVVICTHGLAQVALPTHKYTHSPTCARIHPCVLTCLCVCSPVCAHTCVHTFTRAHHVHGHIHPHMCSLACAVTHTGACAPRHGAVLLPVHSHACGCIHPCACMCSPVCIDVRVPVSPPRSCVLALSMLSANHLHDPMYAHVFTPVCACIYSYTPPLCTCAHLHAHGLTCKHPPTFPRQRACAYAPTHVYAPADACPCPLTRACAHTYLHSCTHGRACARVHPRLRVLTRVCLCHPAAGAALASRLSQPCPGSWGCQGCTGGLRCPGTKRGCQAPLRGARLARGGPGAGIWPARERWPCPRAPPCSAGVNQGAPEPAQQQHCTNPLSTATLTAPSPVPPQKFQQQCHGCECQGQRYNHHPGIVPPPCAPG